MRNSLVNKNFRLTSIFLFKTKEGLLRDGCLDRVSSMVNNNFRLTLVHNFFVKNQGRAFKG